MRLILLFTLSLVFGNATARMRDSVFQVKDTSTSIFDYLISQNIVEISLKTAVKQLQKNRYNEVYQPAELSFFTNEGARMSFEITIRTRGNMRKKNCQFPSLKLNFDKTDLRSNGFNSTDKYKLVCQCSSGKNAEQLLLKEYLAYKLYNIITDNSFRVHLFKIKYVDPDRKKTKMRYGFLIESEKELAKRLDARELVPDSVNIKLADRENVIMMGMFQYMIGNTDFSMLTMHNLTAVELKKSDKPVLIAYDFDYSGLVDAKYATPNPELPIRDVKDRWFNIKGCSRKEIEEQIQYFQSHKEQIMSQCQNFKLLKKHSHSRSLKYIAEFFTIIENPASVNDQFIHK